MWVLADARNATDDWPGTGMQTVSNRIAKVMTDTDKLLEAADYMSRVRLPKGNDLAHKKQLYLRECLAALQEEDPTHEQA